MKVYTKTGDTGETSLLGGTRVLKSDLQIEAYGTVDELNCYLGLVRDLIENQNLGSDLITIQNKLFSICSHLANDQKKEKIKLPEFGISDINFLEVAIDKMEEQLPPLTKFILPGGHPIVSHIHISRGICRRAERCTINFNNRGNNVNPQIIQYLNRLSDYLFVLGRLVCKQLKCEEIEVTY